MIIGTAALSLPILAHADDTGSGTTDVTVQVADGDENITWSAPTQVPFKATASGTLIGPAPDSIAIKNLSAFSIRVKTMNTMAIEPFHLVDDVDKSTNNNDMMMTWNGVQAKSHVELPDDGTWAMGYQGNKDGSDVLPLTYSASKIARVTADLSKVQKSATISWTVEPTTTIKPEPKPDPNGVAFAVYSADDNSLDFYKRDRKPEVGDTFNGKTVTAIDDVDETKGASSDLSPFTNGRAANTVDIVDNGIKPIDTYGWFSGFSKMESAYMLKLNISSDTDLTGMFSLCSSLEALDLSSWDTSNVTRLSHQYSGNGMFHNCPKLKSVDVSGWDTSNVTCLEYLFESDSSLTTIDGLNNWELSKASDASCLFRGCSSLASLDLSGWKLGSKYKYETGKSDMFENCPRLTYLNLSGWTMTVHNYGNGNGTELSLPSSLRYLDAANLVLPENSSCLFQGLNHLIAISGTSSWYTSNVTDMSGMFEGCQSLEELDVSNWDTSKIISMGEERINYRTGETEYVHGMFQGCSSLYKIDGIASLNTSKVNNMSNLFKDCSQLNVDCSNWNVDNVAFHVDFNTNAPNVIAPNWNA